MTKKFVKEWKCGKFTDSERESVQNALNGGFKIDRHGDAIFVNGIVLTQPTPGKAVKLAAALNKNRRPLRLIKKDLDVDWCERVKARDNDTCALCGVKGRKQKEGKTTWDSLTAHHWVKTKLRSRMSRWARANGVTVHFTEHIHELHENPCWATLEPIYRYVATVEGEEAVKHVLTLANIKASEKRVRTLWYARMVHKEDGYPDGAVT